MLVKELIEKLKLFDDHLEVLIETEGTIEDLLFVELKEFANEQQFLALLTY